MKIENHYLGQPIMVEAETEKECMKLYRKEQARIKKEEDSKRAIRDMAYAMAKASLGEIVHKLQRIKDGRNCNWYPRQMMYEISEADKYSADYTFFCNGEYGHMLTNPGIFGNVVEGPSGEAKLVYDLNVNSWYAVGVHSGVAALYEIPDFIQAMLPWIARSEETQAA